MANLSLETERRLAEFIYLVAEGEKEIEQARISLSENRDFEPYSAFRAIDRLGIGFISYLDIREFLDKNRIICTNPELTALIKQYDSDSDGRLVLNEFYQVTLPSTSLVLRDLALQRGPYSRISLDVEFLLARLLEKELSLQRRLELSKKDLALRHDFSVISAFSLLDYPSTSLITRDKINDFLRRNGKIVFEDDIDAILRRMDIDGDERLSFSEFSDALRPQETVFISSPRRSPTRTSPGRHSSPLRRSGSPGRTSSSFLQPDVSLRSSYTRSSPLSISEESELVNIFFQQINLERDLNAAKKDVALCSDFNLLDAFQMFDINDIGYVGEYDLEDTLVELGIRPTRDEINLLFKHYSSLNNRRLTYSEFSKLFTPKEVEYSRILSNRTAFNVSRIERRRVFGVDTTYKLTKVLRLHLESESVAESLRHRLSRRPSFSMHEAFQAVDKDRNGYITYGEFQTLLEQHGIFATAKDVESLMDRYDKDKDGRVSYSEFLDEVTPKSPKKY
jgi:Ca2+-binding EF-hand superfamily protein